MCGIAGILRTRKAGVESGDDGGLIRKMTAAMAHRGPDAVGFLSEGPLQLGHLRLAIIDLSAEANQPFTDESGRYTIIFNGEIYNFRQVRSMIPEYPFRTSSDTEVLVAAYAKWGAECLVHLRGMFAFAIWDRQDEELFLARDRMGVKPLYYYKDDDVVVFASEVRAILATGLVKKRLSHRGLVEYFSYQSVSAPFSPIEGILQLESGSWLKVNGGKTKWMNYWDVTKMRGNAATLDLPQVRKKIRELMLQSVERRLVSDVPVGAFLSGGIDSSAVVGLMAEVGGTRPNTFTVAFEEKEYDESAYADVIVRKFNTCHTRILLKPTVFLDQLEDALSAMDVPSGDGINTYVVSKAIRASGMTVALSGAGGDELFAGYPFFRQYVNLQSKKMLWKLPPPLRRLAGAFLSAGRHQGKGARMAQLLRLPSCSIDNVYPIFRQILSPETLHELTDLVPHRRLVTAVAAELADRKHLLERLPLYSQVSAAEYLGYTQHTLLKDTDQMSMASSLEVREPYFDQDLIEFVMSVPDKWKKPVYPKSLLVESLKPLLPDEIVFRKKQGFLFPWDIWLKQDLRSFCETHLASMAERPFVNADRLMDCWKDFLAGGESIRWTEIWVFVVLEYWLEKNGI
jgi:asparagine synthase (glutamine-hydrolysing)